MLIFLDCNHGDIRINPYNTYTKLMGHVEVCINGSWGSICSDHFDDSDAKVVCRQLGYSPFGKYQCIVQYNVSMSIQGLCQWIF